MSNKKTESVPKIDLDRLAIHLKNYIEESEVSGRTAAAEIGCSPATLTRLLKGSKGDTVPDSINLMKACSWIGMSLSDFESSKGLKESSIADVEVHLRALPDISKGDAEALIGLVKAAYDHARYSGKKSS